ncbi:MAG: PRC-barrel domain-containing protein [Paracoccus sp. (in: a-proteobacteria)]
MKHLLMSAAIAALAVPAVAQDTATPDAAAEEAVQGTEGVADAGADAGAAVEAEAPAEGEAMPADAAAEPAAAEEVVAAPVVAPTDAQPVLDASTPSMLGSWVEGLQVFTTNQPSDSEWSALEGDVVPAEWDSIAKIGDIVIDEVDGQYVIAGYVIDIGGFLGIGAKEVMISTDAIKMATFGRDVIFATNYTRDELGALPDFDNSAMLPATLAPAAPMPAAADPATAPAPAEGEPAPASN